MLKNNGFVAPLQTADDVIAAIASGITNQIAADNVAFQPDYHGGQEAITAPALDRPIVAAMIAGERIRKQDPAAMNELAPGESMLLITSSVATNDETIPVTFKVAGAPEDRLMLVGSDPVVGSWSPEQGLKLTTYKDGFWATQQSLPAQAVICLKLVHRH